jgi:hypothetical protein
MVVGGAWQCYSDPTATESRRMRDGDLAIRSVISFTQAERARPLRPRRLPGSAVEVPAGVFAIQDIVDPAVAAMTAEQTGAFAITSITQRLV